MKPKTMLQSNGDSMQKKKFSKPLMERRRRARINDSLNELKVLVLRSLKKDPSRYSKMEKADILELTVKYLKAICGSKQIEDEDHQSHFLTGYNECARDVQLYLLRSADVSPHVKAQMLSRISATPPDPHRLSPPSSLESSPPMLSSPLIPSPVEHRSLVHTSLNSTGGKPLGLSTSSPKSAFSFSFPSPPASPIIQEQSNRSEIENVIFPPFSRQAMTLPPTSFVCRSSQKYSDGKCGLLGQPRSSHEERIHTDRSLKTIRPVTSSSKELWRPW